MVNRLQKGMRWLFGVQERAEGNDYGRFFQSLADSIRSSSGVVISAEGALNIAAVYCCVRLLSETVAQLPIQTYRRMGNGAKEWLPAYPLGVTLARKPNPWQTSFEFREMMMLYLLLRGNAYAQIVAGIRGAATELWPLRSDRMEVERLENGRLRYIYTLENGRKEVFAQDEIFHIRGLSSDGLTGMSPIAVARDPLGLAKATETYGSKYFANSARPSGILTTDASLKEDAARQNREMWMSVHGGVENSHKVAVLTNGLKWQAVGMSNEDSQFLELRTFQIDEIARIFRVPPHMLYEMSRATFSNIEHQKLEFAEYTILPWVIRWEQAIGRDLVTDDDVYVKFNVDGLKRGDAASRAAFYGEMLRGGWGSVNEVRELEDMDPIEGPAGDAHWMQQQMVPVDILIEGPPKPEPPAAPATKQEDNQVTQDEARELREQNAALAVEVGKLRGENAHLKEQATRSQQEAVDALAKFHERELTAAKQAVYYDNVEQGLERAKATCETLETRCHEQEAKCVEAEAKCHETERKCEALSKVIEAAETHARKVAHSGVERLRRRASHIVTEAAKTPETFLDSVETLFMQEADRLNAELADIVGWRCVANGDSTSSIRSTIDSYVAESRRQLIAVYDTVGKDRFASEVLTVTNGWEPRSAELVAQIFGKEGVENE